MGEQVIHLFQWSSGCLWQKEPEEEGVGEVADDEEVVVFVANIGHGDRCDLALVLRLTRVKVRRLTVKLTIIVLKAKLLMVAMLTPLALVRVSKTSAGIIQLKGPHVAENEKL
jgi:hypothetical protein